MAKRIQLPPEPPSLIVPLTKMQGDESEESPEGQELPPDEDDNKLAEFLQFFGGKEYKVRVEEFDKAEKVWLHLDTFPVDDFEPYETCKRFGPGRYRLTFLNDKGKYVRGGQPQIRIGGRALPAVAAAPASVEQNPLANPIVAMMLAQANENAKANRELLQALLTRPEAPKSTTNEVMDLLLKLKAMDPKEPKGDDTMKKLMEALTMKMIERGMEGGEGGGEGGIMSEIKDALPILKEILAAKAPQRAGLVPAPARPAAQITNTPTPEATAVNPLIEALKPYLAIFKSKAEKNADKERAAQFLLDELDETVIPLIKTHVPIAALASDAAVMDSLLSRAKDPAQVEALFTACPELVPHREWITAVIAQAVVILETPEASDE